MNGWELPREAVIGGKKYGIYTDYRDILEIFSYLQDESLPEYHRWRIALGLFYEAPVPEENMAEAAAYFNCFVNGGRSGGESGGHRLLDWEQDAQDIVADVNKVAGQEIRALPYVHWWTFLSWFHSIGEGNLSTLVTLRDKLRRGKKLEGWEKDFYQANADRVKLPVRYTPREQAERERLQALLDSSS